MNARVLVTGVDSAGRSCVAHHRAVTYSCDKSTDGIASGAISWMVVEYAPRVAFSMHNTDSVDLDTVLAGSVEITLDDGVHELAVGDCVVVTGVDHAWRAGADGCRLSVMSIGVPSP